MLIHKLHLCQFSQIHVSSPRNGTQVMDDDHDDDDDVPVVSSSPPILMGREEESHLIFD